MKNIILFSAVIIFLANPVYATTIKHAEDATIKGHRQGDGSPNERSAGRKNLPYIHTEDATIKHAEDATARHTEEDATAKPFAYSAEKDGKAIHLLGTIHVGVSIEEIPCSNEILKILETSDFLFSEVMESNLTLIRHLGDNWQAALIAPKKERKKILESLPENERNIVSKTLTYHDNLQATALSAILEGTQFVDREKESFENLSPQARELLISRGVSAQGSYVDYLYSIIREIVYSVSPIKNPTYNFLDFEIAKMAFSKNIPIELLDNESKMTEGFMEMTKEVNIMESFLQNAYAAEREIDSNDINTLVTIKNEMENEIKNFMENELSYIKKIYLSGNKTLLQQTVDTENLSEETIEFMFKNRNELWLQKIIDAFEANEYNNIFAAGGAAHFIGPFNVLDMLKEEGFTIKQLSCNPELK